jgi:DNA-binding CsgD family transcriptional regulator
VHGLRGPFAYGDFNGDGRLDAAVCDSERGSLRVYLGDRGGSFVPFAEYLVEAPTSVVAADLDGDGDVDLAVVSSNGHCISVLIGLGDGRFRPQGRYAVRSTAHLQAVVNARGTVDLVAGDPGWPQILAGRGDGSFEEWPEAAPLPFWAGSALTAREQQVAALAARAFRAPEIASRMGIGVRTVETHLERVRSKLGIRSKSELVRHSHLRRLVSVVSTDDTAQGGRLRSAR